MLRPPAAPKKRTSPTTPDVDPSWIEALNNAKPVVAPANAD